MKSKEILYQDVNSMNTTIAAHKKVATQMNAVMIDLSALGVEASEIVLNDILEGQGKQTKEKLSLLLEKEISGYSLPSRKETERLNFQKVLSQVDRTVEKVDSKILQRDRPFTTIIETSLLSWSKGGIVLDEQNIIDQFTIYLDSPEKIKIKEAAESLIKQISDFNELVLAASHNKIFGLGHENRAVEPLVLFHSDNTLSIDGESFRHIYSEEQ